jgi:hypothetical protein
MGTMLRCDLHPLHLSPGAQEFLKWLAVVSMTADHVNRLLLHAEHHWMFWIGRIAMPVFAFVLSYNLAQPKALASGMQWRVMGRLVICAVLATPAYASLSQPQWGIFPLNILFSLLIGTGIISMLGSSVKYRYWAALLVFMLAGNFVEFYWVSLAFMVASWYLVRTPNWITWIALLGSLWALGNINGTEWAFVSLPLIVLSQWINHPFPRLKHFFYAYYPIHLSAIWLSTQLTY